MTTEQVPPTDRLTRIGGVLFVVGVLCAVAAVVPLLVRSTRLPVAFYLGSALAPLGFGLVLYSLWRSARARSRRTRS